MQKGFLKEENSTTFPDARQTLHWPDLWELIAEPAALDPQGFVPSSPILRPELQSSLSQRSQLSSLCRSKSVFDVAGGLDPLTALKIRSKALDCHWQLTGNQWRDLNTG